MSGRPIGPKKLAAIEQRDLMRAKGIADSEIRQALILSGLTNQQAKELLPLADVEKPTEHLPRPIEDEGKQAIINGAVHFLDTIAKRISPNAVDRFNELGMLKSDALTWARKLKGAL